jgi:protein phosphatase
VNEDFYALRDTSLDGGPVLAVVGVADGMGGLSGGDIASRTAIELVVESAWAAQSGEVLTDAFAQANADIRELASASGGADSMGTTLTVAVVGPNEATLCHVGDTRAYLLHDGSLTQVTDDHSRVGRLVRDGLISEEDAMHHPDQNVLERALGAGENGASDSYRVGLGPGDVLFLCTDGLHTFVPSNEIEAELRANPSLQDACERLATLAEQRGSQDNITAVAWQYPEFGSALNGHLDVPHAATQVRRGPAGHPPPTTDTSGLALALVVLFVVSFAVGYLVARVL